MSAASLYLLSVLFGVVALLLCIPRQPVASQTFTLLRCFFPAWRFFEDIAPTPVLSHRVAVPGQRLDEAAWTLSLQRPTRGIGSLWLNAAGNLYLAYQSIVERLHADLDDDIAEPVQTVSYQLVKQLVAQHVQAALGVGTLAQYQFRLTDSSEPTVTLFESEVHSLEP